MQINNNNNAESQLRIIKTARTEQTINEAVEQGFWPLVKPVIPSPEIRIKFAVKQDKETGKITVVNDFRQLHIPIRPFLTGFIVDDTPVETDAVISWTYYYPYHFESPFAAYLVPADIKVGEKVMLEDLIEDVVDSRWNQGDVYRLRSCASVWDGKEFILNYMPKKDSGGIIG